MYPRPSDKPKCWHYMILFSAFPNSYHHARVRANWLLEPYQLFSIFDGFLFEVSVRFSFNDFQQTLTPLIHLFAYNADAERQCLKTETIDSWTVIDLLTKFPTFPSFQMKKQINVESQWFQKQKWLFNWFSFCDSLNYCKNRQHLKITPTILPAFQFHER
jgi:hypothetical protein